MATAHWKRDFKEAASTMLAFDRDRAAMEFHQLLHQGKADPRSVVRAAVSSGDAMKALEHLGQFLGRNAGAGVAHAELEVPRREAKPYLDLALEGKLECIGQQIKDNLFPHLAINERGLGQWRSSEEHTAALQ